MSEPRNVIKTNAWNEIITPALEEMKAGIDSPFWKKLARFIEMANQDRIEHILDREHDRKDDEFIRGQIAMAKEILGLAARINLQLEVKNNPPQPPDVGQAGY